MRPSLLKAYHLLPPAARDLVASWHGRQLFHWRYGPETITLANAALDRETWNTTQWQNWQEENLRPLLKRAIGSVPHYHAVWAELQAKYGYRSALVLRNWPVLSKQELREHPRAFLAENAPLKRLRVEHTSGTTGTPLQLWQSRDTTRLWYALAEVRWRGWYGISRADRWAILGGQLVVPIGQEKPPFWVWNTGLNQLYLSSYHLSEQTCASYLQALHKKRIVYLYGYASSLHSLALFIQEQRLDPPPLKLILSNAEPLYAHQRDLISRVFACPVRDTYGTSEKVCAASECEAGSMHLWPDAGVYEVLRDDADEPVACGEAGRLVCTGLLGSDMPLIRYDMGDRVAIAPPEERCACGRTLPILLSVEGRSDDVILTADGRRIGRLDPVFKQDMPIREAQVIQEALDQIRILVVPRIGFSAKHEQSLVSALRDRVGDVAVVIERVTEIPRSANGKFRAVISNLKANSQPQQTV
jgi:phenylacetate-CoA ligase